MKKQVEIGNNCTLVIYDAISLNHVSCHGSLFSY
jgi:hypothetical protein